MARLTKQGRQCQRCASRPDGSHCNVCVSPSSVQANQHFGAGNSTERALLADMAEPASGDTLELAPPGMTQLEAVGGTTWLLLECDHHEPVIPALFEAAKASGLVAETENGLVMTVNELSWPVACLTYPHLAASISQSFGSQRELTDLGHINALGVAGYDSYVKTWERLRRSHRPSDSERIDDLIDTHTLAAGPFADGWVEGLQQVRDDPMSVTTHLDEGMRERILSNGADSHNEGLMAGLMAGARALNLINESGS